MSLSLVHRICDQCDQEDDLVLMLPTGFQICEKHLRDLAEKKKKKDNNDKVNYDEIELDCPFFTNTNSCAGGQSNSQVPFTIKKLKECPINKLRMVIRELKSESCDLLSKISKFYTTAGNLDDKIDKEFEDRLEFNIEKRKDDLTNKLNEYVNNLYKLHRDQLDNVKRVYKSELKNSMLSLSSIERELKSYKQLINNKAYYEDDYAKTFKILEKKLDDLKQHKEKLNLTEKCLTKNKYLEFKPSTDEIILNFGQLRFKSGELTCVDLKNLSDQTSLEKLFKLGDKSFVKLPDLQKIQLVKSAEFKGHFSRINMLEKLDNGDIVTASNDCTIKIWNRDGKCKKTLFGHQSAVKCFKLLSYDKLVSASSSARSDSLVSNQSILSFRSIQRKNHSTIIVWNLVTGLSEKIIQGPAATIYSIEVADNGDLITADSDGYLSLWDLESGNCKIRKLAYKDESNFCLIKLKNRLVTGAARNKQDENASRPAGESRIKIWDFELNECEKHPFCGLSSHHANDVTCLVKVDETSFLSGSGDGVVKFWNIDPEKKMEKPIEKSVKANEKIRTIKVVEKDDEKGETKQFFCLFDKGFSKVFEIDEKNGELKEQDMQIQNETLFADCEKAYCMEVTDSKEILVALRNKEENLIWVFGEKN